MLTGLLASDVLSTLDNPISLLVRTTVPVAPLTERTKDLVNRFGHLFEVAAAAEHFAGFSPPAILIRSEIVGKDLFCGWVLLDEINWR